MAGKPENPSEYKTKKDSAEGVKDNSFRIKWQASLTYRLAIGSAVLFLVLGIVMTAVFVLIRLHTVYSEYVQIAEDTVPVLSEGRPVTEALFPENTAIKITLRSDGRTVYRFGSWEGQFPFMKYWIRNTESGVVFFLRYQTVLFFSGEDCRAVFVFDATRELQGIFAEAVRFVFCYLLLWVLAVFFYVFSIRSVLRPLGKITKQVKELNIQNLHNVRLDEAGTEDELKALAAEINRMLGRLDEAYEAQKQFVSEASHELRTPITVLQGYSSMLKRWGAEDKEVLAESIDAIQSEAKSMQDLVEKLLFLSRHERKKLPFHKERFDVSEMIEELEKEMEYMAGGKRGVTVTCEPMSIYADKQALKQAIRVFLDNAVKYTSEGDAISLCCKKKNGACEISVEDNGLGMQKKDLEGIFNRFFRSDTVRGKNIDGHGLGLTIAWLIIDGHAGKITVRTQYTKGSCFTITIPRQRGV